MKARVKATGEIVEVIALGDYINENGRIIGEYKDANGKLYTSYDLDFYIEEGITIPDYWTRLEHQYAGMAMQSYVSNNVYLREIRGMCKEPQEMRDLIADLSILLATTIIQKLKEKEEEK